MDTVAEDTGRHHLYRAHNDCAAATGARLRIMLELIGAVLRPEPGQHRAPQDGE